MTCQWPEDINNFQNERLFWISSSEAKLILEDVKKVFAHDFDNNTIIEDAKNTEMLVQHLLFQQKWSRKETHA